MCGNNNILEIKTQAIKNIESEVIVEDWVINKSNFIYKGLYGVQVIKDKSIFSLN